MDLYVGQLIVESDWGVASGCQPNSSISHQKRKFALFFLMLPWQPSDLIGDSVVPADQVLRIWFLRCWSFLMCYYVWFLYVLLLFFCNVRLQYRYFRTLNVSNPAVWVNWKAFSFVFLSHPLSPPKCTAIHQGRKPCILYARWFGIDLAVPGSKLISLETPRLNYLSL